MIPEIGHFALILALLLVPGTIAMVLAGLGVAVPALGSLVLGLALADGALDAGMAHELASLDELFQAEQWGEDAEAVARRERIAEELALAERFMRLSRGLP